ncbi:hypothetical protein ACH34Q_41500 [Actinomadura sp. 9N407]
MADAREALRAIGDDEGPKVVATADVQLALSDMDVEVANSLLTGREDGWLCDPDQDDSGCVREQPRYRYDIRREDAQRAVLQAARLAESDPVRMRTVQALLDGLHRYDQHVQAAMRHGRSAEHAYGALPPDAAKEYQAAGKLMAEELLPKASNLILGGKAIMETTYGDERSGVQAGRTRVVVLGLAAILVLAGLQIYLAMRFRRTLNLFLAAATLGTLVLTVASASLLATEADQLRAAKENGVDPALTLARAQSVVKTLHADRSRYLLLPAQADRNDQTYLEKSQTILYVPDALDPAAYYAGLERQSAKPGGVGRGGFYGARARESGSLLESYLAYQQNDNRVRALAEAGQRGAAARAHLDQEWSHLPHPRFREHVEGLDGRISQHQYTAARTVLDGERALAAWTWLRPLSALAIAALVVAGVWPRLSEYR